MAVTTSFTPNTQAKSSEINANFTYLTNLIDQNSTEVTHAIANLRRQGGSSTDFSAAGTTNYTAARFCLQCGVASPVDSSGVTVTFPTAFSNVPLVFAQINSTTGGLAISVGTITATNFVLKTVDATARTVMWFAIGPIVSL